MNSQRSNSSNSYISQNSANNLSNLSAANDSMSMSILNSSMASYNSACSKHSGIHKINLKERYNFDKTLSEFMEKFRDNKNVLIFVDGKGDLWEMIRRKDLNPDFVKSNPNKIKSIFTIVTNIIIFTITAIFNTTFLTF